MGCSWSPSPVTELQSLRDHGLPVATLVIVALFEQPFRVVGLEFQELGLDAKRALCCTEQGLGDVVQVTRLSPLVPL